MLSMSCGFKQRRSIIRRSAGKPIIGAILVGVQSIGVAPPCPLVFATSSFIHAEGFRSSDLCSELSGAQSSSIEMFELRLTPTPTLRWPLA